MKKNRKIIIGITVTIILIVGYLVADHILFDGFKPISINEKGFQARYYANKSTTNSTAVVLIGGGQWGNYWGEEMVLKGFVGLSLPYSGHEGLPTLPEEIPLEYFETALKWLGAQPEVNPEKIIVMGASRNAELALVIAANLPELVSGVVAYAPSSVSWSNTVLPYNSDKIKPSWTYKGSDINYVPMDKISGNESSRINTLEYWKNGLNKVEHTLEATIKVERINGPILLISGMQDLVWPSAQMADILEKRLEKNNFKFNFENIKYDKAGHLISSNPESQIAERTGKMIINDKQYSFEYGGTNEGDYKAKQDAKIRVFKLIENL
ncbi:palmitoyl-CoA hydrolase [Arenibacter sp. N53]|uniref:acyl-CoA thioester hydrolase/BAAT C-terminal domain-containing protein n=1 Tax=Arenibacter TaxID=178469 RepID=UPI000CD420F5|nr:MULTISPECIES: acyl-CoA thioester hydrolase/BAAT C-terminal domain-containing protein [Arenibacter]MCM4153939.1 palmitoyl-CoA hydrolase [Arenibacter sp. N53]